ncbi:MAG: DUF3108 domain-containing protein [Melioribacteraceae bacterium]|nr:DUF3108 domain-containing protein [Melioribacteraceae bacterium]
MKLIVLILLLSLFHGIHAQTKEFRKMENNAFSVGEKLTFDVNYGFITAGVAVMEIPKIRKMAGRDTYHITFHVNSVSSFDPFFKVRDRYETFMDVEALFPWRFEQHIREGSYSRDFSAFFDHRRNLAKTRKGSYEIPENVNDIVSAFYLARTFNYDTLKVGDGFYLENFYKDKVYPLQVVFRGKETVTVEAGTFDCIMVEPLVVEGGLFKSEGSIIVWLTDDEVKMPVKVKSKVIIGSIDAELIKFEGVSDKMTSRLSRK